MSACVATGEPPPAPVRTVFGPHLTTCCCPSSRALEGLRSSCERVRARRWRARRSAPLPHNHLHVVLLRRARRAASHDGGPERCVCLFESRHARARARALDRTLCKAFRPPCCTVHTTLAAQDVCQALLRNQAADGRHRVRLLRGHAPVQLAVSLARHGQVQAAGREVAAGRQGAPRRPRSPPNIQTPRLLPAARRPPLVSALLARVTTLLRLRCAAAGAPQPSPSPLTPLVATEALRPLQAGAGRGRPHGSRPGRPGLPPQV